MNIIIAGAGKVSRALAQQLAAEGHNLTIIDQNSRVLENLVLRYDAIGVHGNCASKAILLQAGVEDTLQSWCALEMAFDWVPGQPQGRGAEAFCCFAARTAASL